MFPAWVGSCLTYLLLLQSASFSCATTGDNSFSQVLLKLANEVLGVQQFQDYLDGLPGQSSNALNGANLVREIAEDIGQTLEGYTAAVRRLRAAILRDIDADLTGGDDDMKACCDYTSGQMSTDVRLRTIVDLNSFCRSTTYQSRQLSFVKNTLPAMIDNFKRTPTLKWQYFGSRDGLSFVYPAASSCVENFDPRLRPWYYSTASGKSKDMVIVIQVSSSMERTFGPTGITKLKIAIDTAKIIVQSLSPNDRVSILTFAETPNFGFADNCYKTSLAAATPQNKQQLLDYLNTITTVSQDAWLGPALAEAFHRLSNATSSGSDRVSAIFLLTDGRISEADDRSDIFCSVKSLNNALNNAVVIMTFGIESTMSDDVQLLLKSLAEQNFNTHCNENITYTIPPTSGRFAIISDPNSRSILLQIGLYYDAFPNYNQEDPVFSVPYRDSLGIGLVSTACLPVISSTQLLGVACVDVPLDLVFNDVINFKLGQLSYAYLIDGHGRALLHPAVPQPETNEADPVFIEIRSLETSEGSGEILNSMMRGQIGREQLNANLILNRGSSQLEGVDVFNKFATYYWNPVPVMNVSVCLVIIDGEVERSRSWTDGSFPPVLLADHINVFNKLTTDPGLCSQWGKAAESGRSNVKLAPMSFEDPFNYSLTANTVSLETSGLRDYLEGKASTAGPLSVKKGVREVVALTHKLEEFWKDISDPSHFVYTMFTYIGTEDGIFRNFPGTLMPKEYDPTRRPWYTTAVGSGQIGKVTVSRPYIDSSGGILLTLCKTIYEGSRSSHSVDDPVFGVMGLDITLQSFYNLLVTKFEPCSNENGCFVIDNSGFVIVHKDYVMKDLPPSAEHITSKEPGIAFELMSQLIMRNDSCVDYADITVQSFWKINLQEVKEFPLSSLYPVDMSNIYIVVPNTNTAPTDVCKCDMRYDKGETQCLKNERCQCPCYSSLDYNYCSGITRTTLVPCLPPTAPLHMTSVEQIAREQGAKLPDCRPCDVPNLFNNPRICVATKKCCWNYAEKICQSFCLPGNVNPAAIAVPVVLGVLIILLFLLTLYYCRSKIKPGLSWLGSFFSICRFSSQGENQNLHDSSVNSETENSGSPVAAQPPAKARQGTVEPRTESLYYEIKDITDDCSYGEQNQTANNHQYLSPSSTCDAASPGRKCRPPTNDSISLSLRSELNSPDVYLGSVLNPTSARSPSSSGALNLNETPNSTCMASEPGNELTSVVNNGVEVSPTVLDEQTLEPLFDGGYIQSPLGDRVLSNNDFNIIDSEVNNHHPTIRVQPMKRIEENDVLTISNTTVPKVIDDNTTEI